MWNQRRKTRLFKRLALAFAVALVAVPVAQAYPDEGANVQATTFVPGVTDFAWSSYIAPQQAQPASWPGVDPQTVPSDAVPEQAQPISWPGVDPQAVPSDAVAVRTVPMPRPWPGIASINANPNRVAATESVDWGSSGIGAATAIAVILLGSASLLAVRGAGASRQATA